MERGDRAKRMDLCHWVNAHPELLNAILFTDEVSFTRDGINNLRNVHTWTHRNPHATCETHFQRRFSLNVWCGMLGKRLIGPFVFDNNLTGNTYEALVRNELPGLLEDIPLMIRSQMYFQHDGALTHYTNRVGELLNELFPSYFCCGRTDKNPSSQHCLCYWIPEDTRRKLHSSWRRPLQTSTLNQNDQLFNELLKNITLYSTTNNTVMRDSLSVEERLALTLRLLSKI